MMYPSGRLMGTRSASPPGGASTASSLPVLNIAPEPQRSQFQIDPLTDTYYEPIDDRIVELAYRNDPGYLFFTISGALYHSYTWDCSMRGSESSMSRGLAFQPDCTPEHNPTTFARIYNRWAAHSPWVRAKLRYLCDTSGAECVPRPRLKRAMFEAKAAIARGVNVRTVKALFLKVLKEDTADTPPQQQQQWEHGWRDEPEDILKMWQATIPTPSPTCHVKVTCQKAAEVKQWKASIPPRPPRDPDEDQDKNHEPLNEWLAIALKRPNEPQRLVSDNPLDPANEFTHRAHAHHKHTVETKNKTIYHGFIRHWIPRHLHINLPSLELRPGWPTRAPGPTATDTAIDNEIDIHPRLRNPSPAAYPVLKSRQRGHICHKSASADDDGECFQCGNILDARSAAISPREDGTDIDEADAWAQGGWEEAQRKLQEEHAYLCGKYRDEILERAETARDQARVMEAGWLMERAEQWWDVEGLEAWTWGRLGV